MSDGLAELTVKEKEALRLLLAGHDAKSSATELDISVHTVNDRLRNARRKLGVSSSREAARILGNAEGAAPQIPAHISLGIPGSGDETNTADLINTQPRKLFGLTWFAGGMLIMSILIAAAALAMFYSSGNNAELSIASAQESSFVEQQAAQAPASLEPAEEFLKFVDAGDWKGSWDAAGRYFQSQVTAAQWAEQVDPVRTPLGDVESRFLSNVDATSALPGAPEGEYEVLQFQTDFAEMDGGAVETVVMIQGKEGWEVIGYFIRPGAQ